MADAKKIAFSRFCVTLDTAENLNDFVTYEELEKKGLRASIP